MQVGTHVHVQSLSRVQLFMTPWTHQAPLSMGILQARILECVAMPPYRGSADPGIRPGLLRLLLWQPDALPLEPQVVIRLSKSTEWTKHQERA